MTLYQSLLTVGAAACLLTLTSGQAAANLVLPAFNDYDGDRVHAWGGFAQENKPPGVGVTPVLWEGAPPFLLATASQWMQGITIGTGATFGPASVNAPGSTEEDPVVAITHFNPTSAGGGIYNFSGTSYSASSSVSSSFETLFVELAITPGTFGRTVTGISLKLDYGGVFETIDLGINTEVFRLTSDAGTYSVVSEGANPQPGTVSPKVLGYQVDLSEYGGFIGYEILFDVAEHSAFYGLWITESSDSFTESALVPVVPAVIPEPSTYALIGAGLAGAAFLRRRRAA